FLPASLSLLVMAFVAIALTGLYGILPSELRIAALAIYGVVVLPLGCLIVGHRTLRALACGRGGKGRTLPPSAGDADAPRRPAALPLNEQERPAGTPEQAQALLAATGDGAIERALALIEAGADPATAPAATD